jgi:ribosomal protein L11 methyltransferase
MTQEVWWRLEAIAQDADTAASALWEQGAGGVEIRDDETFFLGADWVPVPEGKARLVAYFEGDLSGRRDALAGALSERGAELVALALFEDDSWRDGWREFFTPRALSERATVGPPWADFDAPPGGVRVVIDPGMAFGTGTHETTRLVAQLMDEELARRPGAEVLDVGCGSAILSILAAALGSARVVGVDVDGEALVNARENVERNLGEGAPIALSTTPVGELTEAYPIVLGNILAHILVAISEDLRARVAPGGLLLLSGIIAERDAEVRAAFGGEGWTLEDTRRDAEWIAHAWRRA